MPQDDVLKEVAHSDGFSVVTRFHDARALERLAHALGSLRDQTFTRPIQSLVVTQRFSETELEKVRALVQRFERPGLTISIENVTSPEGDIRSHLLNCGISKAHGRYLAFLDFDDIWYSHALEDWVSRLETTSAAWSVGRVVQSVGHLQDATWMTLKTADPFAWGRDRIDLFADNFLPIHSFAFDLNRIDRTLLQFDTRYTLLEDYAFLLPIAARYEPDWELRSSGKLLGEYRFSIDGSNSNILDARAQPEKLKAWDSAIRRLRLETRTLQASVDVKTLHEMAQLRRRWNQLSPHSQAFLGRLWSLLGRLDRVSFLKWIPFALAKASGLALRVRALMLSRHPRHPSRQ